MVHMVHRSHKGVVRFDANQFFDIVLIISKFHWQLMASGQHVQHFVDQMPCPCEPNIYKQLAESPCCDKKLTFVF